MNEVLKSSSFPRGLPPMRSEAEVRAGRSASLNIVDVINAGAQSPLASPKGCPWCGAGEIGQSAHSARFYVGCDNEACPAQPSVCAFTPEEAMRLWNTRAA